MSKWMGQVCRKNRLKILVLSFSSKLDWGSYIISIAKTAPRKTGALIRSLFFLSPEVAIYLCKSTVRPCMEYFCPVWGSAANCLLDMFDKLQKRTLGLLIPSLATSFATLANLRNVTCLSRFCR